MNKKEKNSKKKPTKVVSKKVETKKKKVSKKNTKNILTSIKQVKNRDGLINKFDANRIHNAIFKAFTTTDEGNEEMVTKVLEKVLFILNKRFGKREEIPTIENIQDIVEESLILLNCVETAKNYILYREQRRRIRESKLATNEAVDIVDQYLKKLDWEVKENSNTTYSLQSMNVYISSYVSKKYWLNKIYPPEIRKASRDNFFHIHDLGTIGAYCCGWDLYDLLKIGFKGVPDKIQSKPAKHFRTVLGQVVNYFFTLQGEVAGAQAFSNFDTYIAPFIRYDRLNESQIKQALQEFLFNCNVPTRVGFQTPFTNITLDLKCPGFLKDMPVVIGGELQKETYGEFQMEMDVFNRILCEVFTEGDASGRVFTFPIPTYNITKDFEWNNPAFDGIWRMTAKYGLPYFSNFINSDMSPDDARSMCIDKNEEILIKQEGVIKKVKIGDFIESLNVKFDRDGWAENNYNIEALSFNPNNYKIEWSKITNFLKKEKDEVYEIVSSDGKVTKISSDHLVAVYERDGVDYKKAKDLKLNDLLLTTRKADMVLNNNDTMFGEYALDNDLAFFMGIFMADGVYIRDSRKQFSSYNKPKGIQISFNKNQTDLIDKVSSIVKNKFDKNLKIVIDKRFENTVNGIFNSRSICENLENNGLYKYHKVPVVLFNSKKEIIQSFLDGFFSGDGYEKRKEIHINDDMLAKELVWLYTLIGIPVTYKKRSNSQVIRLQHTNNNVLKLGDILYNRVPNCTVLKSKKQPFYNNTCLVCKTSIEKHDAFTDESWKILTSDMAIVKINKINVVKKIKNVFYDIELARNHYFIHSMGQITHNCCRLRLDNRELYKRGGGLFGANPKTGSIGVVTLNLPKIAYLSKTKKELFKTLRKYMDLAKASLEIKRKTVEDLTEKGLYPYSRFYLQDVKKLRGSYWANHFSTIGLVGGHEMAMNFIGEGIDTKSGQKFIKEVLDFMRDVLVEYQKDGSLYNLEATPAEGTSYRLARIDKKEFSDIATSGTEDVPYYTNSTQMPVDYSDDLFEVLDVQDSMQTKYTGGTVLHGFIGEEIMDYHSIKSLLKTVFTQYKLPYLTVSPTFSVCPIHGYIAGEHHICPKCVVEQKCEVYSRVVGYIRPVNNWHDGKRQEFKDRVTFSYAKGIGGAKRSKAVSKNKK